MAKQGKRAGRAPKGSVQIKNSNGRLQLVFSYGGKRHYVSTGFADAPVNRKSAEMKARQIELDILSGNFDASLAKYKPESLRGDETEAATQEPSLAELWERFIEFKRPQCSENTMRYTYGVYSNYLQQLPTQDLRRAVEIRDFVLQQLPVESAKRFLTRLSACCDLAVQSGAIAANPFAGLARTIKTPKSSADEYEIDAFAAAERDAILAALRDDRFCPPTARVKHSYYFPLIAFLFKTGCRPSEAIALQWAQVQPDLSKLTFQQRAISTVAGRKLAAGLKNGQQRRVFPCNSSLRELLAGIRPEAVAGEQLVFPSPAGTLVDTNNLRNRVWARVLAGLGIRYRKLYQTRHTFITLALESVGDRGERLDAKDVARLVGNSPETIYEHYAAARSELVVPEF